MGFSLFRSHVKSVLFPSHSHLNEDVRQCVIYDSPDKNGRLIGVEYIISAKLFEQLPPEEKKYWHSHVYEVCLNSFTVNRDFTYKVLLPPAQQGCARIRIICGLSCLCL
jgi:hypothetical protein